MKSHYSLIFFLAMLSFAGFDLHSQNIRVAYSFYAKRAVTDTVYKVAGDMMLDYDGRKSVFYSDGAFHRDSLSVLAFDENGNVKDDTAYKKIFDYPSPSSKDVALVDYAGKTFTLGYHEAVVFILGHGSLEAPRWKLSEESETDAGGYLVRKATADYLGRTWTAWYCPDIPVPAGPWLFWGTPGLITSVSDSEGIFCFKMLNVSQVGNDNRYGQIESFYNRRTSSLKHYEYDIAKAETVHTQARRDLTYLFRLAGESDSPVTEIDRNGRATTLSQYQPYLPLIPDIYWKK